MAGRGCAAPPSEGGLVAPSAQRCESAAAAEGEEGADDEEQRSGRSTQTFPRRAKAANAALSCQL